MNGRIVYWLLGALMVATVASVGAVYATLSGRVNATSEATAEHSSRIATLEAQTSYIERDLAGIKTQLTLIHAEVIALRVLVAQKLR